jgi:hypothetical protein
MRVTEALEESLPGTPAAVAIRPMVNGISRSAWM